MAEPIKTQTDVDLSQAQKTADAKSGKGKKGREKRKKTRKGSPISLYVRDKISAADYFRATNQRASR